MIAAKNLFLYSRISFVHTVIAGFIVCLAACDNTTDSNTLLTSAATITASQAPGVVPMADSDSSKHHYYFDVNNHTKEEVLSLLKRAQEIYESLEATERESLKIAMVLHGPDLQYFAKHSYEDNKDLVDTAANLEANGFIDLKVCAISARSHGVENDGFPAFIETVPYGPGEIRELEKQGYTKL